jgi:AraC-like DNA-binding protein
MDVVDAGYRERAGRHAAVAAVWSSVAAAPSATLVAADGCFDLILRVAGSGHVSAFVYTPVTRAHYAAVEAGDRYLGVRLRPGFGPALVEHPELVRVAEQFVGRPEDLESLVANAVEACAKQPSIVTDFVAEARTSAGALRLTRGSTAARERELQRACLRWLGLSPKAFLRVERVWAAREAIRAGTALAIVAADFGYADQAHLTREVRELLGVTPSSLRRVGNLQDLPAPIR